MVMHLFELFYGSNKCYRVLTDTNSNDLILNDMVNGHEQLSVEKWQFLSSLLPAASCVSLSKFVILT